MVEQPLCCALFLYQQCQPAQQNANLEVMVGTPLWQQVVLLSFSKKILRSAYFVTSSVLLGCIG